MTTAKQLTKKIVGIIKKEKNIIAFVIQVSDQKETDVRFDFRTSNRGALLSFISTLSKVVSHWWDLMEKRGILGPINEKETKK